MERHHNRQVMGMVVVAITKGNLDLGRGGFFYSEFDRQRPKRVLAKVIGE